MRRILLVFVLICLSALTPAQVVFQSGRGSTINPTLNAVEIETHIEGSMARTDLVMVFANPPTLWGNEAKFLFEIPDQSFVTGFSYWFNNQEIKAKVETKERAHESYEKLRERRIDPALAEMVGKKTLAVSVFPVDSTKELRIRFRLVSTLANPRLVIPFAYDATTLERAKFHLEVHSPVKKLFSNLGVVPRRLGSKYVIDAKFDNQPSMKELILTSVASSSGTLSQSKSGLVAGVIARGDSVKKPEILSSQGLRSVFLSRVDSRGWCISGAKSSNSVSPSVTIRLRTKSAPFRRTVTLSGSAPSEAAALAYGHYAIERAESSNRATETIRLSKQFGLPSQYTAYIAIPEAERQRLVRIELQEKLDRVVSMGYEAGITTGYRTPQVKALRDRAIRIGRVLKVDGAKEFDQGIAGHYSYDVSENGLIPAAIKSVAAIRKWESSMRKRFYEPVAGRLIDLGFERAQSHFSSKGTRALLYGQEDSTYRDFGEAAADLRQFRLNLESGRRLETVHKLNKTLDSIRTEVRAELHYFVEQINVSREFGIDLDENLNRRSSRIPQLAQALEKDPSWLVPAIKKADLVKSSSPIEGHLISFLAVEFEKGRGAGTRRHQISDALRELRRLKPRSGAFGADPLSYPTPAYRSEFTEPVATATDPLAAKKKMIEALRERSEISGKPAEEIAESLLKEEFQNAEWEWLSSLTQIVENKTETDRLLMRRQRLAIATGITAEPDTKLLTKLSARDQYVAFKHLEETRESKDDKTRDALRAKFLANPQRDAEFNRAHLERIDVEFELAHLNKAAEDPQTKQRLFEIGQRRRELRIQMGDPLLILRAPKSIEKALAELPTGEIKSFEWNEVRGYWQLRFDVPSYQKPGRYLVKVWIYWPDGRVEPRQLAYNVDTKPPIVKWTWDFVTDLKGQLLVNTDEDVSRIELRVGGRELSLTRLKPGLWTLDEGGKASALVSAGILIVTDKAHNQTMIPVKFGATGETK